MVQKLQARFESIYSNKLYYVATLLDPRFKSTMLDATTVDLAKDEILTLTAIVREEEVVLEADNNQVSESKDEELVDYERNEPGVKKRKFDLWSSLRKVIDDKTQHPPDEDVLSPAAKELAAYLNEETIADVKIHPSKFWHDNKTKFPTISAIALRFLHCPPSSVASESLFSSTGNIDGPKRRSLLTEKIEMLTFIKRNIDILD